MKRREAIDDWENIFRASIAAGESNTELGRKYKAHPISKYWDTSGWEGRQEMIKEYGQIYIDYCEWFDRVHLIERLPLDEIEKQHKEQPFYQVLFAAIEKAENAFPERPA